MWGHAWLSTIVCGLLLSLINNARTLVTRVKISLIYNLKNVNEFYIDLVNDLFNVNNGQREVWMKFAHSKSRQLKSLNSSCCQVLPHTPEYKNCHRIFWLWNWFRIPIYTHQRYLQQFRHCCIFRPFYWIYTTITYKQTTETSIE